MIAQPQITAHLTDSRLVAVKFATSIWRETLYAADSAAAVCQFSMFDGFALTTVLVKPVFGPVNWFRDLNLGSHFHLQRNVKTIILHLAIL